MHADKVHKYIQGVLMTFHCYCSNQFDLLTGYPVDRGAHIIIIAEGAEPYANEMTGRDMRGARWKGREREGGRLTSRISLRGKQD